MLANLARRDIGAGRDRDGDKLLSATITAACRQLDDETSGARIRRAGSAFVHFTQELLAFAYYP
jgi:hypothetical protein